MAVFFQHAGGRRPVPRMPVGLGTKLASTKPQCISERDKYMKYLFDMPTASHTRAHKGERGGGKQFLFIFGPFYKFHQKCSKNDLYLY